MFVPIDDTTTFEDAAAATRAIAVRAERLDRDVATTEFVKADRAGKVFVDSTRVGGATVDLQFRRRPDGSASWRVIRRHGPLLVVGAGPPDADDGDWWERLEYGLLDRMPGRLSRAARIALGRW